ncbi:hypothetical protein ABPG75_000926 [Micractinium tetrahymenae]
MASALPQGALAAPGGAQRRSQTLPAALQAAAGARRAVLLRAAAPPTAPSEAGAWGDSPFSDADDSMPVGRRAASNMRVEDLAPQHWRTHLEKLKPGERRALRRYIEIVARTNALRHEMAALSDEQLAGRTADLRQRLLDFEAAQQGAAGGSGSDGWQGAAQQQRQQREGQPLLGGMPEGVVVEAFAVVREAAQRVLGIRHYDVQLLGGLALHEGQVAEMATGEGKTLVATLPAYVNALTGRGVHIVTVNDYLAKRDAEWIGKVFSFLGLSVGVVTSETQRRARMEALAKDVTYITAYDLVFAYLSDYNVNSPSEVIMRRSLHYALVDEVDSILIDEAINPFILTIPSPSGDLRLQQARWSAADEIVCQLKASTFILNSDTCTDEEWEQLEAAHDVIARPKYYTATVTARGMARAVGLLAAEGHVVLAADAQGRLAVGLLSGEQPGQGPVQFRLGYADAAGAVGSSGSFFLDARLGSREAAAAELRQRGLEPLAQPSWQQLEAAVPLALWQGQHAWGVFLSVSARAHHCYFKDVHYLLRDDRVVIIDLPTGRERSNSVWQSGIHQAVEAKHGVKVRGEDATAASVSYQAFFRYYRKLAGMTGTGATEEVEFSEAYGLPVVRVPPHRPSQRRDHPLQLYFYEEGRNAAIQQLLWEAAEAGRPVLVGTGSVQESAEVQRRVVQPFVEEYGPHVNVSLLNADPAQTRFEAAIIAQAGLPQSITIATNLAGRGTDILLGGNPKGLVQMLLENKLLGAMAPEAPDQDAYLKKFPLHHLERTFQSPEDMEQGLPPALMKAFRDVTDRLACILANAKAAAKGAAPSAGAQGQQGAPAAPDKAWLLQLQLPWRGRGKGGADHATRDAAAWLGRQVEAAEVAKAHLRLHECLKQRDWWAAADLRITEEQQRQEQPARQQLQQQLEAALQRFILLQWLWFDRMCEEYAEQVRAAGGLRVVLASLPDTRRSELQLRGRSGRQGDPGDTHLVLSLDDPQLILRSEAPARTAQHAYEFGLQLSRQAMRNGVVGWEAEARRVSVHNPAWAQAVTNAASYRSYLEAPVDSVAHAQFARAIATIIAGNESYLRSSRDGMRRYDEVVDRYRRHVYRLRRMLVQGGSADRRRLLHVYFQDLAHSIVSRLVDASQPPSAWDLPLLARHLYALVNQTGLDDPIDFRGQPWQVGVAASSSGPSMACSIAFDPEQVAEDMLAALQTPGCELPSPPVVPLGAPEQAQQPAEQPKGAGQAQLAAVLGVLPPQQAQQAAEQLAATGQARLDVEGSAPQQAAAQQQAAEQAQQTTQPQGARDLEGVQHPEEGKKVPKPALLRLRERQQLAALRSEMAAYLPAPSLPDANSSMGGGGSGGGGGEPAFSGRYAPQARLLVSWVAEFLAVQYRNKRELLKAWYRSPANTVGGASAAAADGLAAVCERDALVARLDNLWMDFLEDVDRTRRIVSARAYSAFDPLQEFQLEASSMFAQLLLDFKQRAAMDAFCHVSMTQIVAASRLELTTGQAVISPDSLGAAKAAAGEEEEEEGRVAGLSGSGGGSGGGGSQKGMEAQGLAAILDRRPDLAQRVEQESRALAAQRHAAAAAERAAIQAQADSAEALGQRLQAGLAQVTNATGSALELAKQAEDELLAATRQLPLQAAAPAWDEARRRAQRAEAAVVDMYRSAVESLEGPALAAAQANAEFEAAALAINVAAAAGNAAGRVAALIRMRAAADAADRAAENAAGWYVQAKRLQDTNFQPRLADVRAAVRAAADGSSSGSSSNSSNGASPPADSASSTSLGEVRDRIVAAMARIRQLNQDAAAAAEAPTAATAGAAQEPPADPTGLALGALMKLLQDSAAQQAQQQGTLTDTPAVVHPPAGGASSSRSGTPQQQSSSAIDESFAQMLAAALQQSSSGPSAGNAAASSKGSMRGAESYGRVRGAVWGSRSTGDALRQLSTQQQQQQPPEDEEAPRHKSTEE